MSNQVITEFQKAERYCNKCHNLLDVFKNSNSSSYAFRRLRRDLIKCAKDSLNKIIISYGINSDNGKLAKTALASCSVNCNKEGGGIVKILKENKVF